MIGIVSQVVKTGWGYSFLLDGKKKSTKLPGVEKYDGKSVEVKSKQNEKGFWDVISIVESQGNGSSGDKSKGGNRSFALSYAKDIINQELAQGKKIDDIPAYTLQIAEKFILWLDKKEEPKPAEMQAPKSENVNDDRMRAYIAEALLEMNGGEKAAAVSMLLQITTFQGTNGPVAGVSSTKDLKDKRLFRTFKFVETEYMKWNAPKTAFESAIDDLPGDEVF